MRRWILLVIVATALSAGLNTMVAWTCLLLHEEIEFNGARLGQLRADGWDGHGADRAEESPEIWLQHSFTGRGVEIVHLRERSGEKSLHRGLVPGDVQVTIFRAGWPMPALEGRMRLRHGDPDAARDLVYAIATGREVSLEFNPVIRNPAGVTPPMRAPIVTEPALPLRPIWPGFAVNTLLCASVTLTAVLIARVGQSLRRQSRGQCAGCGYPIGASPQCSECGRAVRPRFAAPVG